MESVFCFVSELKESENHPSNSFKKLWVGGWLVVVGGTKMFQAINFIA